MDLQRSAVRLDQGTERPLVARLRAGQQHADLGLVGFSGSHFALTISNGEKRRTSSVDRHEYSSNGWRRRAVQVGLMLILAYVS